MSDFSDTERHHGDAFPVAQVQTNTPVSFLGVVHRGKIVENERAAVKVFHRDGSHKSIVIAGAGQVGREHGQNGTKAFSARKNRIVQGCIENGVIARLADRKVVF